MEETGRNKSGRVHSKKGGPVGMDMVGAAKWNVYRSGGNFIDLVPDKLLAGSFEPSGITFTLFKFGELSEQKLRIHGKIPGIDQLSRVYEIVIPYEGKVQFLENDLPIRDSNKLAWLVLFALRITAGFPNNSKIKLGAEANITTVHRTWLQAVTAVHTREDVSRRKKYVTPKKKVAKKR